MPAFRSLGSAQIKSLVSYVRALQGRNAARVLPGNVERGREIFFGKGECARCHAIGGQGGFLGPDLTSYGSTLSATAISEGILNSNRIVPSGYKSAIATTREGSQIKGIVRNEDNFSVQVLSEDGSFHFFQKSELQKFEYASQSLMPTSYGERFNHDEINDIVSYLMESGSSSKSSPTKGREGDEE